jgi:diguanylate cyclase (GGDEF)-like protein
MMAGVDELTGLLVKDEFPEIFRAALAQAKQAQKSLALIEVDLDHFLLINENQGHDCGDAVLQVVASILMEHCGGAGYVFRYGGDEMHILLPDTGREQAFLKMENIRAAVEGVKKYGQWEAQVTISAGISSFPVDGAETDELQRKANQAMYRAKHAGGNQIMLAYDEKLIPKTTHYTETQLERLSALAEEMDVTEARLLREALDDLILKYRLTKL